jgi:hypothetical protein
LILNDFNLIPKALFLIFQAFSRNDLNFQLPGFKGIDITFSSTDID